MNALARRAQDAADLASVRADKPGAMDSIEQRWADAVADHLSNLGMQGEDLHRAERAVFESVRAQISTATPVSLASLVMRCALEVGGPAELHSQRQDGAPERAVLSATEADALAEDEDVAALLWNCATILGPAARASLDLHHRVGLDPDEIADALDQPRATVEERLERLPLAYNSTVRCALAWCGGHPEAPAVASALSNGGVDTFGPQAVRIISEVLAEDEALTTKLTPEVSTLEMFAAIPLVRAEVADHTSAPEAEAVPGIEDVPQEPVEPTPPEPEPQPEPEPESSVSQEPPLPSLPRRVPDPEPEAAVKPASARPTPSAVSSTPRTEEEAGPSDADLIRIARILGAAIAGLLVIYLLKGGKRRGRS